MTQSALKAKLIAAIEATDNQSVLDVLENVLENQNNFQNESIDIVAYNKDIDDALEAVARGEFTDHETVRKRFLKSE
jgi:hypothetical protein